MAERKRDIPRKIDMIVDKKRRTATKVSKRALIAIFLIGCLCLPIIGGVELARFAGARQASDEGSIVFTRKNSGVWVMSADGKNEEQPIAERHQDAPAWSPDGKQIAFAAHMRGKDPDRGIEIYIMNADGSNIKQVTEDLASYDVSPTWSPDGKQIAFTKCVFDAKWREKSSAICVMNSDGSNVRKLIDDTAMRGSPRAPDWSPDRGRIAFHETDTNSPNRVWIMDADGSNARMVYKWGEHPAWSPDGRRIVFASKQAAWKAWKSIDIYMMDADGSNVKILTDVGPSWDTYPEWSPDGTKIVFCSDLHNPVPEEPLDIYVMDADGTNVQRLTNTPWMEWFPDWWGPFSYAVEPDGKLRSTWGKLKRELFSRP
jgi:Tol biopolymer transport system component